MTEIEKPTSQTNGLKLGLMAAVGTVTLITAAFGQISTPQAPLKFRSDYFGYSASVSPRVTYSDNINLNPSGTKEDDIILSNMFTTSAIFSNRRFTGIISGDLDLSYLTDRQDFRINQNIGGTSTFTAIDNWLYADFSGQTTRQLIGDNARFSANPNASRGQRADVHSFSVSPYVYHKLANQSAVELRYRFSQVFIDDNNSDINASNRNLLNDSQTHEVLASYQSGALFDRMQFTLSAYGNKTIEEGSNIVPRFEYEQGSLMAEGQYALSRKFSLSGAVGYDDVSTDSGTATSLFDDDQLSGFFWRAGFTARPGRRTNLRLEYGRRYDDDFIDASLSYNISRRLSFRAGASRTFQTRAQSISRRFRALQQQTLEFADRLKEGDELSAEGLIAIANEVGGGRVDAQSVGIGASNNVYAQLNGKYDRTNISVGANYQDTDFGFRQVESFGGNLNFSHDFSRKLRGYANGFYRHADSSEDFGTCFASPFLFGFASVPGSAQATTDCNDYILAHGKTNTVGASVGMAYQLYKNLSVFGEYSHTERFSPVSSLEYGENSVTAGITLDF